MAENKKILIVEDDAFVVDIYSKKLREEGYKTEACYNGADAWKKLSEGAIVPDLILLDIVMPEMNGLDLVKKMREKEDLKKIPVILLTNMSEKEDITAGFDLGAVDYLIKSHFTPQEVIEKVNTLLKK